jgi:O-antigen/teichoic acid export membrane protein
MASVGPFGSAAAQFALSLTLLQVVSPEDFGVFSFLFVTLNLCSGLWGALFCAPLPALLAQEDKRAHDTVLRSLFGCNLIGATAACALFVGLSTALGASLSASALFGFYAAVALLRWFGRTFAYATGVPLRAMWSDLAYSATLVAGVAIAVLFGSQSLDAAFTTQLIAAAVGMLAFGRPYLRRQFSPVALDGLRAYRSVWRRHSSWSLLGVITTEATANSHAYIVTSVFGPSAFAPIAAAALLIRPVQVAMNALVEFERAQMAAHLARRHVDAAKDAVHFFRRMLTLAWAATAAAAALLLTYWPGLVFPAHYDLAFLRGAAVLWMMVSGIRLWRTPDSALLQAAGAFRQLAYASVLSAGVSIVAVCALLSAGDIIWSIAGIGIGEAVFAFWTGVQVRRWYKSRSAAPRVHTDVRSIDRRPEVEPLEEIDRRPEVELLEELVQP